MKRLTKVALVLTAILILAGIRVQAQQGRGQGMPGSQRPRPTTRPPQASGPHDTRADRHDPRRGPAETSAKRSPADLLTQNTKLAARLESLLPEGTNLQTAAAGFKNLGQFVAAVHVSKNLNLPFEELKAKLIGSPEMKLGQAIHELRPGVDAKAEAKKAQQQAKQEIRNRAS